MLRSLVRNFVQLEIIVVPKETKDQTILEVFSFTSIKTRYKELEL